MSYLFTMHAHITQAVNIKVSDSPPVPEPDPVTVPEIEINNTIKSTQHLFITRAFQIHKAFCAVN